MSKVAEDRTVSGSKETNMGRFISGVMASQIWPTSPSRPGATADAMRYILDDGFFAAVQTVHVPEPSERHAIRALVEASEITYTYTLTRLQSQKRILLGSLDEEIRRRSIDQIIGLLDEARDAGAHRVGIVSGPGPEDPVERPEALHALSESLAQVTSVAPRELTVVVEPLDAFAHKRHLLGTTREAVTLMEAAAAPERSLALCLDTAHMLLNGEDLIEDTSAAFPWLGEFHFSNPVLDMSCPEFGDNHRMFGSPGALAESDLPSIWERIYANPGFPRERGIGLFFEVINREPSREGSSEYLYEYNKALMKTITGVPG